jgi:hypothetical protein
MKHGFKQLVFCVTLSMVSASVLAKLPPPSEEAKAKAEEAKVKKAEADKKAAEQLSAAMDKVAARYIAQQKAKGIVVKPTPIVAAAPPAAPAAAAPAAVPATAAPAAVAQPAAAAAPKK